MALSSHLLPGKELIIAERILFFICSLRYGYGIQQTTQHTQYIAYIKRKHIHYIALWTAAIHLQSLITRRPQVQVLSPQPCLTADFVRNQRFFVFFRALRKPPGKRPQKWKVVWKGSGIKKMLDVKVLFLIPETKILTASSNVRKKGS